MLGNALTRGPTIYFIICIVVVSWGAGILLLYSYFMWIILIINIIVYSSTFWIFWSFLAMDVGLENDVYFNRIPASIVWSWFRQSEAAPKVSQILSLPCPPVKEAVNLSFSFRTPSISWLYQQLSQLHSRILCSPLAVS